MNRICAILLLSLSFCGIGNQISNAQTIDIYKAHFTLPAIQNTVPPFSETITSEHITAYTDLFYASDLSIVADTLSAYRIQHQLSDWMFFQMVRRTANYIFPKKDNYESYTVMKWFLLYKAGFDVRMAVVNEHLLFYAHSNDEIEDIPYFDMNDKRYYCLNRHDYGTIDFEKYPLLSVPRVISNLSLHTFSYKIATLPEFVDNNFSSKLINFEYDGNLYQFDIPVNTALDTLFVNYPVVNYESYFNIPLSEHTYESLIPQLQKALLGKDTAVGVEYLMMFTRKAFAYQNDVESVDGKEKRFSPELTLINDKSDCDDRVGLLHFLIKELYNLPMIVVQYPSHVILGVALKKQGGDYIAYNSNNYLICEPTPQVIDYPLGKMYDKYYYQYYEVTYEYKPDYIKN